MFPATYSEFERARFFLPASYCGVALCMILCLGKVLGRIRTWSALLLSDKLICGFQSYWFKAGCQKEQGGSSFAASFDTGSCTLQGQLWLNLLFPDIFYAFFRAPFEPAKPSNLGRFQEILLAYGYLPKCSRVDERFLSAASPVASFRRYLVVLYRPAGRVARASAKSEFDAAGFPLKTRFAFKGSLRAGRVRLGHLYAFVHRLPCQISLLEVFTLCAL